MQNDFYNSKMISRIMDVIVENLSVTKINAHIETDRNSNNFLSEVPQLNVSECIILKRKFIGSENS